MDAPLTCYISWCATEHYRRDVMIWSTFTPQFQNTITTFTISFTSQNADFTTKIQRILPIINNQLPNIYNIVQKNTCKLKLPDICPMSTSTDCTITHCDLSQAHWNTWPATHRVFHDYF